MKVFINSIFAQLFLIPYIYLRGYQVIPKKKSWRIPYMLFFIFELVIFFAGFFFHNILSDQALYWIMRICFTWYIASIYITMALVFFDLIRVTNHYWRWYPAWVRKHYPKVKLVLFCVVVLGVSGVMVKADYNVTHPIVRHQYIDIPKSGGTRDSLTIAMMSDLHIGEMITKPYVQNMVRITNEQNPEMVVIVGDYMDYESYYASKMKAEEDLRQLKAPLGVYAVLGNHEYRANLNAKKQWIRDAGATLLVDSVMMMPDSSFYLIGRDDYINKNRKPLAALMRQVDKEKPLILLDHQPNFLDEPISNGVDLGLYGHTHDGQIWPNNILLSIYFECSYGYHKRGNTQFFVSSGIGAAGPPYRIGTRAELVMLHIRFTGDTH